MSRYDQKIETSLEGIEHLSKEKIKEKERKMKEKNWKNHYYFTAIHESSNQPPGSQESIEQKAVGEDWMGRKVHP